MAANTPDNITNIDELSITLLGIIRMENEGAKNEEVMGEETLTRGLGNVGGAVKTRTLEKRRVWHPKPGEGGFFFFFFFLRLVGLRGGRILGFQWFAARAGRVGVV